MSPAPVEKRLKVRFPAWAHPLADIPLYGSLPHTAGNFQRQLTNLQRQIYFLVKGRKDANRNARMSAELGCDVFRGPGHRPMARSLNVHPKTVYRNLQEIQRKGYWTSYEITGAKGERLGTWYAIPQWKDVFAAQAGNPELAKVTVNGSTRVVVIGRARRFMTVEEEGEGFIIAADPKTGNRWEVLTGQVTESAELPDSAEEIGDEPEAPAAEPIEQTGIEIVLAALNEACTTGAGVRDAEKAITEAQRHAAVITRGRATPTAAEVAAMVRGIGADHAEKKKRRPGFIFSLLEAKVHVWNNARLLETAERTRAEARAASNDWAPASEILGESPPGAEAAVKKRAG